MGTTSTLPADLAELGPHGLAQAITDRSERADALIKMKDTDLSASVVGEMKALNDDLVRLREFESRVQPHPGHGVTPGGSRRSGKAGDFGRVEGLGAAFLKELGGRGDAMKALDATSGGASLPASFFDSRLRDLPQRQLFLRSLIPSTTVTSDKVNYIRQTVFTNNAAAVAAGALKPTSVITAERVEAPVRVIAHLSEALDRSMLTDYDQLTGFIDDQLRLGVLLEEEDQILNGSGAAPNLTGILNTAGIQTQAKGADPTPDAVYKAITKIRVVFGEPDAVVFHPNDWQDVALLRNADGVYLWGSPANEAAPRIWNKQVIVSPVMAEGTALVGSFGTAAEVFERETVRISFAETGLGDVAGQELFSRNQIRVRAESRIGLAVIRPSFFCTVTGV